MNNLSYFDKKRISNIVWTITKKYGYELDFSLIQEDYFDYDIVYNSIIIGSLYNILDYTMILDFINLAKSKINKNKELLNIFFMCIETSCVTKNTQFIENIKNIRQDNYKKILKVLNTGKNKDKLYNMLRLAYYDEYLGNTMIYPNSIKQIIKSIQKFKNINDTISFIENFKELLDVYFKFEEESINDKSKNADTNKNLSHIKQTQISILHNNTQTIQEFFDNYTSSEFNPNESVIEKNLSIDSSTMDENKQDTNKEEESFIKMEQYYGKSIYSKNKLSILEKKHCHGIHSGYKLFFTDGDIDSIKETYRKNQILEEHKRNEYEYDTNKIQYENSIEKIKSIIRQSMKFEEKLRIKSFSGNIDANKIYRAEKIDDYKIFNKEKRRDEIKFLVDIVIDSSASLLDKQSKLSVQAYVVSRALEELGIKNSVKTFNSFMDYSIIKILKNYEEDSCEKCFDYFCSSGNRDGLAIDVIGAMNEPMQEYKKMMIVFTDARPYDVQAMHKIGVKAKKPYQGDLAIDDTANVVRKLRQKNIKLCGIFSGADEDIKVIRYIYGSDFLHIVDIGQFSNKVGRFISDYISNFYE